MKKTIAFFNFIVWVVVVSLFTTATTTHAAPYGKGNYGDNVPYGSQTALSISTDGNVGIPITPTTGGTLATGTSTVTVSSTDVVGYKLYIRSLTSTNMVNGGAVLPASANGSPTALSVNTWGYNTDASTNFVGMTLSDVLLKSVTGPVSGGDPTTVTYGVKIDLAKPSGNYTTTVIYTAVPQTI